MEVSLNITSCQQCPHLEEGMDYSTDGWDRGNDWTCKKAERKIAGFVEWHDKIKIPQWCPIATEMVASGAKVKMCRPCDCKDSYDVQHLEESGIKINDYSIAVSPNVVIVEVPGASFRVPMGHFKKFAEWYLKEQEIQKK